MRLLEIIVAFSGGTGIACLLFFSARLAWCLSRHRNWWTAAGEGDYRHVTCHRCERHWSERR